MPRISETLSVAGFISNRKVQVTVGVAMLLYAPIFFYLLALGTPRFIGIPFPQVYFWLAPISIVAFALMLIWRRRLVRISAWVTVLILGAWLVETTTRGGYLLFQAYYKQTGELSKAFAESILASILTLIEASYVSIPMMIGLVFALVFRGDVGTPSNPSPNQTRETAPRAD